MYRKADDSLAEARAKLNAHVGFYNERRPHRALDDKIRQGQAQGQHRPGNDRRQVSL